MMPSTLYYKKYVRPCINIALKVFAFMANVAALCVIVGAVWKSRARLTPEGKATVPPENLLFLTPLKS